jgi:HEAT repeat protein
LIGLCPYDQLRAQLLALLRGPRTLAHKAVRAIESAGDRTAIPALCDIARSTAPELAIEICNVLGGFADSGAQPTLIALLAADVDNGVRAAAAKALASAGTVQCVEPLLPLSKGLTIFPALKEAARTTIRQIQSRLGAVAATKDRGGVDRRHRACVVAVDCC